MYAIWLFAVHAITWHLGAAAFALCDRMAWFHWWKACSDDRLSWRQMMPQVILNQVAVLLPALWLLDATGQFRVEELDLSAWQWLGHTVYHALGLSVTHDVMFYVGHRLLHTPTLYRMLRHDVHHSTYASVAASSMYMSIPDFVVEIVVPFTAWFSVGQPTDWRTAAVLVTLGGWTAMYEHSGYVFYVGMRCLDSRAHMAHHQTPNIAFSEGVASASLCDRIMGTSYHELPKATIKIGSGL